MKKLMIKIVVLWAVVFVLCLIARSIMGNVYTVYLPVHDDKTQLGEIRILDRDGTGTDSDGEFSSVLSIENAEIRDGRFQATFRAMKEGRTCYEVTDKDGKVLTQLYFRVGKLHTVWFENTMGFTGDFIVVAGLAAACLLTAFFMIRFFVNSRGASLFSYTVMYVIGFSIFVLSFGLLMLFLTFRRIFLPVQYFTYSSYSMIAFAGFVFLMVTCPLVVLFAVLMMISNIELLRHERKRFANVLGIFISLILIAGEVIANFLYHYEFTGSQLQWRVHLVVINVFATCFVYFECMLFGAVICGIRAARQTPDRDKDFIIILGCGFRKDGSLTPLLKGRVDNAVRFWRAQRDENGKTAVLIPSGGQGPDEVMPESEAMSRYLETECSIPPSCILRRSSLRSRGLTWNQRFSSPQQTIMYLGAVSGRPSPACRRKGSAAGPSGGSGPMPSSGSASAFCGTASRWSCFSWSCSLDFLLCFLCLSYEEWIFRTDKTCSPFDPPLSFML